VLFCRPPPPPPSSPPKKVLGAARSSSIFRRLGSALFSVPSLAEEDTPVAGAKTEEDRAIDADLEMAMSNSVKNSHSAASKVRALARESFKQVSSVLRVACCVYEVLVALLR
jgi:predicted  nucleic acid-binding Zn-ribbon protein